MKIIVTENKIQGGAKAFEIFENEIKNGAKVLGLATGSTLKLFIKTLLTVILTVQT